MKDWRVANKDCDLIVRVYIQTETGRIVYQGYLAIVKIECKWPRTDLEIEEVSNR